MIKKIRDVAYSIKQEVRQIFVYPRLTLGKIDYDAYWNDKRGENMGVISDWQQIRADFVVKIMNGKRGFFLDIGCGDGSVLNYLKDKGVLSEAIGVDISKFALEHVKKLGFDVIEADIANKSFIDSIPDAEYAILFEILEHIPHSETMLQEVYKRMRKGVFFSFPNTGFFVHRFRLLFGKFPLQWRLFPGEHLRFWTKKDLIWWLRSLGYRDFKVNYYKGVPAFNEIWPSFFAAGFIVFIKRN